MKIPAGSHKIEWKFEPEVVVVGGKIAMAGSVILLLFFVSMSFLEFKKSKSA
jgi:hypothetical protein